MKSSHPEIRLVAIENLLEKKHVIETNSLFLTGPDTAVRHLSERLETETSHSTEPTFSDLDLLSSEECQVKMEPSDEPLSSEHSRTETDGQERIKEMSCTLPPINNNIIQLNYPEPSKVVLSVRKLPPEVSIVLQKR